MATGVVPIVALSLLLGGGWWFFSYIRLSQDVFVGAANVTRRIIEVIVGLYVLAFTLGSLRYLWLRRQGPDEPDEGQEPTPRRAAVIYLCCDDLDEEAVESLSRLESPGELLHILHDDSKNPQEHRRVDRLAALMEQRFGARWEVLRRPDKSGGKPGALNYVLEKTHERHDVFLLADSDSYALDPDLLQRACRLFRNRRICAVQFRNKAYEDHRRSGFPGLVAGAIDMFDAFMTGIYRGLWQPFVGHNALLRTRTVMEAGAFTPGVFADDIDLTVRMNLLGGRVIYRRDMCMYERHPPNYRSFCTRSQKWAQGCAQVTRMHALRMFLSRRIRWREKIGFGLFCGFYLTQAAMVLYIALVLLALPLLGQDAWRAATWALIVGTALPLTIFLPVLAYMLTEGRGRPFWPTIGACAATYGSTDFWTVRGLVRGLKPAGHEWTPTNSVRHGSGDLADWGHFGFGAACLAVPYALQPELLLFPVTWIFAAKFLFVPAVAAHYREGESAPAIQPFLLHLRSAGALLPVAALGVAAACIAPAAGAAPPPAAHGTAGNEEREANPPAPSASRVTIEDGRLLIDGEAVVIKGVHYSPWRPGEGPGRGFDYPTNAEVSSDLAMIESAAANTILAYDAPERAVEVAERFNLNVIYVFNIQWWRLPEGATGEIAERISSRVSELRDRPSIILWMLGNEVPGWVIDALGPDGVADALAEIRDSVRQADPQRPVAHGNLATHRAFGLDRAMDVLAYNVYPFYPTEVAVLGYEAFLEQEIMPLADGRPVIITEFGANTIEVAPERQGDVLQRCWKGLLDAGCQGGVVFEFANEWWKNYDNPIKPPDWWRREQAPDDHLTKDRDPEEEYGIVTAEREPKPAYFDVRAMFQGAPAEPGERPASAAASGPEIPWWRWAGGALVGALLALALWAWWRGARGPATPARDEPPNAESA